MRAKENAATGVRAGPTMSVLSRERPYSELLSSSVLPPFETYSSLKKPPRFFRFFREDSDSAGTVYTAPA